MIRAENRTAGASDSAHATGAAELGVEGMDRFARMDQRTMATALFILSEAVFFSLLILAYVFYRASPAVANGPNAKTALDIGITSIFTACLLASSATIWLADRSLARGKDGQVRLWLLATILLGGVFLAGQAMEYARLLTNNVTVAQNVFGTSFFTLTGFHGLHVLGGLIALLILFILAMRGQFKGKRHNSAIASVSLYWHFVDVVWVVVFSVIYIWALF